MLAELDSNKQNLHNYLKYTYKSNELALLIKYLKFYFKVKEKKNLKLFDLNYFLIRIIYKFKKS